MRKVIIGVLVVCGLGMVSCAESDKKPANEVAQPKKEENLKAIETPASTGKEYVQDAVAYAMNSRDLGTWMYCFNASQWSAEAKSGSYTFLSVTDESLKIHERIHLKELTRPENKKLLNETVGRHILKGQFTPDELLKLKEVETINGKKLQIDAVSKTIDGIPLSGRFVVSPSLYLLVIDDIMRYPIIELKESVARQTKK